MNTLLCLTVVGVLVVSSSVAQQARPLSIAPGQRVRVTFADGRSVVGELMAQTLDSLRIQPPSDGPSLAVVRSDITSVERSRGRHGHAGSGAVIGLLVGGSVGAALGSGCEGEFLCPGPGGGALLLGTFSAGVGAFVGVFVRSERWELAHSEDVHVGLGPVGRAAGVRVSLRF